jgi:hypothetical protein
MFGLYAVRLAEKIIMGISRYYSIACRKVWKVFYRWHEYDLKEPF